MERQFIVELRCEGGQSTKDLAHQIEGAGARLVEGFEPVPMAPGPEGAPSVCFTVEADNPDVEEHLRQLENLVQIYGAPRVEHFSAR